MLVIAAPGQGAQTPGFLAPWLDLPGVADRLAAKPGNKVYGVPSVKANWYAEVKRAGAIGRVHADMPVDREAQAWTLSAVRKPVKLAAAEKRSGHARMLSAVATESRGGSVVIEGSSVEKAQAILGYLREHQLIDY